MEILLAEVSGFCFGVRRAIDLAEGAVRGGRKVNALGPLVHNPQETARLDAAGVHTVASPAAVDGDTVVIRAHGARPETFTQLQAQGLNIVDATCPFVERSRRWAREFSEQGYTVVLVGHPDHPELQGILGYVTPPAFVISTLAEVASLPAGIRPAVLAQTTVSERLFREIIAAVTTRFPQAVSRNTVCSATRMRQEAARGLAAQVEVVYVVGGRESSNTNRLAEICRELCPATYLIETADEIDPANLNSIHRLGIAAGASTPDWLIQQVIKRVGEMENKG